MSYLIATDNSIDIDIIQLAVFIQGVNKDFQIVEELLKLIPVKGKTGVSEVFSELVTLCFGNTNFSGKN
jgi:hypothetical protein